MNKQELAKAFRDCADAMSRVVTGWDDDAQQAFHSILENHDGVGLPSFDEAVFELQALADGFESYSVSVFDLVEALEKTAPIKCEVTYEYPDFALITLPNEWQFSIGAVNRDENEQFGWDGTRSGLGHDVHWSNSVGWEVTSALNISRVIWAQILDGISEYTRSLVKVGN
jgi:hypothetical protein